MHEHATPERWRMNRQMVHSRSYAPFALLVGSKLSASSRGSSAASIAARVAVAAADSPSGDAPSDSDLIPADALASCAFLAVMAAAASFLGVYRLVRTTPSVRSCSRAPRSSLVSRLRSPMSHLAVSSEGESAAATQSSSSWQSTEGLR